MFGNLFRKKENISDMVLKLVDEKFERENRATTLYDIHNQFSFDEGDTFCLPKAAWVDENEEINQELIYDILEYIFEEKSYNVSIKKTEMTYASAKTGETRTYKGVLIINEDDRVNYWRAQIMTSHVIREDGTPATVLIAYWHGNLDDDRNYDQREHYYRYIVDVVGRVINIISVKY